MTDAPVSEASGPIAPLIWRYGAILAGVHLVFQTGVFLINASASPLVFALGLLIPPVVIIAAQLDYARRPDPKLLSATGLGLGVAVFGGLAAFFVHFGVLSVLNDGAPPDWIAARLADLRAQAEAGGEVRETDIQSLELLASPSGFASWRGLVEAIYGALIALFAAPVIWLLRRYFGARAAS